MGLFSELLGAPNAQDHTGLFSTSSKYFAQSQPSRPTSGSNISQPGAIADLLEAALSEASEQPRKKRQRTQVVSQAETAPPSVETTSHPQPAGKKGIKGKSRSKATSPTAAAPKPAQAQGRNTAEQVTQVQDTASLPAKKRKNLNQARPVPTLQAEGHAQVRSCLRSCTPNGTCVDWSC